MTQSVAVTTISNITTSSPLRMSSNVMMSNTPSSARMSSSVSATVAPLSYNSSVWPTLTASVASPFVCTSESCRQEIECKTSKLNIVVSNEKSSEWKFCLYITEITYKLGGVSMCKPVTTKIRKKINRAKAWRPYLALIMRFSRVSER